MDHEPETTGRNVDVEDAIERKQAEIKLDSVTLARLLAEVRNEDSVEAHAYNRMHNRHNR